MKKLVLVSALALSILSLGAQADDGKCCLGGGFKGPSLHSYNTTVKKVLASGFFDEDDKVTLTGFITQSISHDDYLFSDGTGDIKVDIDKDKWRGLNVTPKTKVTLFGKIDVGLRNVSVDVKKIELAQ